MNNVRFFQLELNTLSCDLNTATGKYQLIAWLESAFVFLPSNQVECIYTSELFITMLLPSMVVCRMSAISLVQQGKREMRAWVAFFWFIFRWIDHMNCHSAINPNVCGYALVYESTGPDFANSYPLFRDATTNIPSNVGYHCCSLASLKQYCIVMKRYWVSCQLQDNNDETTLSYRVISMIPREKEYTK